VIVDVPLPAVMGDVAVTVDCVPDTAPASSAIVPDVAAVRPGAPKLSV
jgi:hypothetical protein